MMIKSVWISLLCSCCLSVSAYAFQEQTTGAPANGGKSPVGEGQNLGKVLDLSNSGAKSGGVDVGGGVKIPGLGALGVLPKLDFGLELLYGDAQTQGEKPIEDNVIESDRDGLRIKGTLKHRF